MRLMPSPGTPGEGKGGGLLKNPPGEIAGRVYGKIEFVVLIDGVDEASSHRDPAMPTLQPVQASRQQA